MYLEMGARGPWCETRGHEGARRGPTGDCGRDLDFIPRATKPEKETRMRFYLVRSFQGLRRKDEMEGQSGPQPTSSSSKCISLGTEQHR